MPSKTKPKDPMRLNRTPGLRDLARQLDLSVTTVSRALKNGSEVKPETIARVQAAAQATGYVPNPHGLSLRTGKTRAICAILPMVTTDVLGDIGKIPLVEGMTAGLEGSGYTFSMLSTVPEADPMAAVRQAVEGRMCDGLIITRMETQDRRAKYLAERGFPFVAFGQTELFTPIAFLDVDNRDFAYRATVRLIERGHKRIVLHTPISELTYASQRILGYRQALAEAGLPFDQALVGIGDFGLDESRSLAKRMFAVEPRPTACICGSEVSALGTMAGMRELGLIIGRDVSVISRDCTSMTGYFDPPITSFFVSMEMIGRRLIAMLLDQIDGQIEKPQELIKTDLIERSADATQGG